MKRDSRDNGSAPPPVKQQKVDLSNISVRFLIPARAAGLIIGKGGENIKKIRSQYSVKLNIPDSRGTERIFTVEGELTAIGNVMRELVPKLKDIMNAKLSDPKRLMGIQRPPRIRRGADGEEVEQQEEEDEGMMDIRILVHQSVAGSIIGKGGDRIREFRSKHKMRVIKVYQTLAPASTDRVVQLVAEPENAINCLQSVVEVVENTPIRGPVEHYNSSNSSEAIALSYGGWLSPEGQRAYSQGIPINPTPDMVAQRGMPPMGHGDAYSREDPYNRGSIPPHNIPPPNIYDGGRSLTNPPPVGAPNRRAYDQNSTYRAPSNYEGMPPMSMRGPVNPPMNQVSYEEQVGSYQPPSGGYGGGMVLQSTGGYGGPVSHSQTDIGVAGQIAPPYKSTPQAVYGAPTSAYSASTAAYSASTGAYGAPTGTYGAPAGAYGASTGAYGAPTGTYGAPTATYGATTGTYGASTGTYGAPTGAYGAPTAAYGAPTATYNATTAAYGAGTTEDGKTGQWGW